MSDPISFEESKKLPTEERRALVHQCATALGQIITPAKQKSCKENAIRRHAKAKKK